MALPPTRGLLKSNFLLPRQDQTNWCWAAIGVALSKYFRGAGRRQCELAQAVIAPPGLDCCAAPGDPACNCTQKMTALLAEIQVARRQSPAQPEGIVSFDIIKRDIGADRPLVCLHSSQGLNHYVVIVGWSEENGRPEVVIDDPADGFRRTLDFSTFFNFGGRQWVQTTRLA
jgi:hypothetical protein